MKILFVVLAGLSLLSPDRKISVDITTGNEIRYSVSYDGQRVLSSSTISMTLADGTVYGGTARLKGKTRTSVNGSVDAILYEKAVVPEVYNSLLLKFGKFNLEFRAYNQGVAYRFITTSRKPVTVAGEQAEFAFARDWNLYVPYVKPDPCDGMKGEKQFMSSFENLYSHHKISEWKPNDDGKSDRLAFLPLTVETSNCLVCITESDLYHYPGMYLGNPDNSTTLKARFAPYPKTFGQGGYHNNVQYVVDAYDYIARADGGASFPWRIIAIAGEDKDLIENDMVYLLARPSEKRDWSWVEPGKAVWEWLVDWNLRGVPFTPGVNTKTYEYFIDYASEHNVKYLLMDEGWFVIGPADMMQINPDVDMVHLCQYAKAKGVKLVVWAGCYPMMKDMDKLCKHYSEMGIAGFKVDFLNRDDQQMVEFCENMAATTAKYNMVMFFHGVFKPTGLSRRYPNVLNYEGDYALENMKWPSPKEQPVYDVTMPFTRLVAGPVDSNLGLMENATHSNWFPSYGFPQTQGTRCHQLAAYMCFFAPFGMLSDAPTTYDTEKECFDFIRNLPSVWDETRALAGKIGEYSAVARRKGDNWYIGAMTNWDPRALKFQLDFLEPGAKYMITCFRDGLNSDRDGRDYLSSSFEVDSTMAIEFFMHAGGGWAAKIERMN